METSNSVPEIHEYRPSSSCDALPADRRNKTLECILATLNVSSAIMSYALEQIQADRIGVICQIASSKLSTSCLHGYTVSFGKMQASSTLFWEAIFATPPTVLTATIHTLLWKMMVEKKHFFGMASSLVLLVFRHGVETSNFGDVSAQKLCPSSGNFSLEQVGIDA